jgi:hypothetical protein
LLQAGVLVAHGSIDRVIEQYTLNQIKGETIASSLHYFQPDIKISNILINGSETISGIVVESRLDISFKISFNKQTNFELDIHLKKEDIVFASYANFVSDDVKTFGPGTYQMSYSLELDNVKSGWYKLDLYFTDPFVSWFALSENIISLELVNKKHHTFLNSPTLKWGSVMLAGRTTSARID